MAQRLAGHVLNDGLGGVEGALVLVVFEQVLEDVAEHLGIDADLVVLVVLGVVLVDGEVVFAEEAEQFLEEQRREIQGAESGRVFREQAAIQVGQAGAGEREEVAFAVRGVERLEEERGEVFGMEAVGFPGGLGFPKEVGDEVLLAAGPIGRSGGTAEPAFALEEVEEDETAEEFLGEVADGGFPAVRYDS